MPAGSRDARTRSDSAATGPACGWNTGTARRISSEARTSVAWPPPHFATASRTIPARASFHRPAEARRDRPASHGRPRLLPCAGSSRRRRGRPSVRRRSSREALFDPAKGATSERLPKARRNRRLNSTLVSESAGSAAQANRAEPRPIRRIPRGAAWWLVCRRQPPPKTRPVRFPANGPRRRLRRWFPSLRPSIGGFEYPKRHGLTSVDSVSGQGSTLNDTSVSRPSVPQLPAISLTRSSPVTFFITRPPFLTNSPDPLTKRTPSRLSRAAPAEMRRDPEMLAAASAPIVGEPFLPVSPRQSPGSKASICPVSASAASISAIGVPARAVSTSSPGLYSLMPLSPAVERMRSAAKAARCRAWCRPPAISSVVPLPAASRTNSAASASEAGSNRSFGHGFTRLSHVEVEREDLGRIHQPARIEGGTHAHLLVQIGLGELVQHQVALFDADAVFAGQTSAGIDAELQDFHPAASAFAASSGSLTL
jgi:hypothetical protein